MTEKGLYPCINGGISPSGFTEKYNSNENTITISEGGASCGFINYLTTKFWASLKKVHLRLMNEKESPDVTMNEVMQTLLNDHQELHQIKSKGLAK